MGTFRGGGLGMGMRAERSPHSRSARAAESDLARRKAKLKKSGLKSGRSSLRVEG